MIASSDSAPELSHHGRGGESVAERVTDRDAEVAVAEANGLVPVAADGQSFLGRQVPTAVPHLRDEHGRAEQAPLQLGGDRTADFFDARLVYRA